MLLLLKFVLRYQTLFCCLILMWALGIIIGTLFLTTWGNVSKLDRTYPGMHQLLQKRAGFSADNPKVARALKYCSSLMAGNLEQEGEGEPGSRLEAVVLMMRHGDRGPMKDFYKLSSVHCGLNFTDNDFQQYLDYMQSHIHSRPAHDAFRRFAVLPKGNSCLPGRLTQFGALQQLRTGRLLRQAYVGQWNLLRENWTMDEVVTVSTMVERTYQSAVSFLFGFLPNFDFMKLNLKVGLGSTLCYTKQFCHCPSADKLNRAVEREKWELVNSHPAVQGLVEQVDSALHFRKYRSSSAAKPDDIFDKLLVFVCHQTSLPCYSDSSCVSFEQLNNIISFLEWRGKQLIKSENVRLFSVLTMHGFLMDLVQRLIDVRNRQKKHRFIFYSAHDKTLMPLMVALGFFDGNRPPFSSRLIWELYSRPHSKGERIYHLKIVYNGKDVTKRTSFCSPKKQDSANASRNPYLCLLDTFVKFVRIDYLKELNATSFRDACIVPPTDMDYFN